jgi:2-isopropylmalate synthase
VLDEKAATAACVRVLMRSTDGRRSWTTVGVSGNVLEASLIALVDSIEYTLIKNDSNNEVKTE